MSGCRGVSEDIGVMPSSRETLDFKPQRKRELRGKKRKKRN